MLKDLGLGWLVVFAVFVLIALMFTFATPGSVAAARKVEDAGMIYLLGNTWASRANEFANRNFRAQFVNTGIVAQVQAMLIPTEENKQKATGLENFVPQVFLWAQQRIDGFWGMLHGSYKRLYLMAVMLMFSIPALAPAMIGGLIERRILIEAKDVAKAVYFHGAKRVLFALILAPLFILFWPWAVSNLAWFAWFYLFPVALWVASKNVQEL